MSGEFRVAYGPYMHNAIAQAADELGRHPISQALAAMYAALAPVEHGAAWFEAYDSSAAAPVMALIEQRQAIIDAANRLKHLADEYGAICAAAIESAGTSDADPRV